MLMNPSTVRFHELLIRPLKGMVKAYEFWLREQQGQSVVGMGIEEKPHLGTAWDSAPSDGAVKGPVRGAAASVESTSHPKSVTQTANSEQGGN